jgi:DNA-binding Xre family transcriptional regulator
MQYSKIEKLRDAKNLSIIAFKQKTGISESTYHNIKNGKSMSVKTLEKICKVLQVNPGVFWQEENDIFCEPAPEGYKKICKDCLEKDEQIRELFRTIKNLNDLCEEFTKKKEVKMCVRRYNRCYNFTEEYTYCTLYKPNA